MVPSATAKPITVVVIDDDEAHRDLMCRSVRRAAETYELNFEILAFSEPGVALASMPSDERTVVLLDYHLEVSTAVEWLPDFVQAKGGPVIVVTSCGDENIAAEAFRKGAADYICKETAFGDAEYVASTIRESLRRFRFKQTNRSLSERLKRTNRELEKKNDELQRATEGAHAFVEDVAHDFRTPLAVIKEFASIIADGISGPVTDGQREQLAYIDTAVDDLAHMVDDFLDSAKLRARLVHVKRESIDASQIIDHVRPIVERKAAGKGIDLDFEVQPGAPRVFVDLSKAARVLVNLVVNAVKFSPRGGAVRVVVGPDRAGGCRLSVIDEGQGIAEDDLEVIFERFGQIDVRQHRRVKGFGLGLSISVQMAAMNFGRLDVKSDPGKGSVFSLLLPASERRGLTRAYAEWCAEYYPEFPIVGVDFRPTNGTSPTDLHAHLCKNSFVRDLIFEPDGSGVRALGPTDDVRRWLSRLDEAVSASPSPGHPGSIEFHSGDPVLYHLPRELDELLAWVGVGGESVNAAA